MIKIILTILISSLSSSSPDGLSEIYHVIKHVETNNNPDAVGDDGKAYGIVQIHKIAVDDVNRIYGTHYTHEDAFDEVCSKEIFELYISAGIRRFKTKHIREPTEEEIVRMWNGGIYQGYAYQSTLSYYRRYKKFKLLINNHEKINITGRADNKHVCQSPNRNRFKWDDRKHHIRSKLFVLTRTSVFCYIRRP